MNNLNRIVVLVLLGMGLTTSVYPIVGELLETAGQAARGAVDVAADVATGTADAVTYPFRREDRPYEREYLEEETYDRPIESEGYIQGHRGDIVTPSDSTDN